MNLKNHFLVAMPKISDELFKQSVVYICEHNAEGAMGIIINKPIADLTIESVLNRLDINQMGHCSVLDQPIFSGGPIADEQGFILHTPQENFAASIRISDDIMVTTSLDLLRSIGSQEQPRHIFFSLGYAGWQQQQLEQEILNNDWIIVEADAHIVFNEPISKRWQSAAKKLGINITTISPLSGTA